MQISTARTTRNTSTVIITVYLLIQVQKLLSRSKLRRKGVNVWYWRLVEGGYKPTPEWSWKNDIIFKEYMAIKRDRSAKNLSKKQYNEQYDEDGKNIILYEINRIR